MDKWIGRVAVVTGASAGIGEGLAIALAKHGMKVAALARNYNRLLALAEKLKNEGGSVLPIRCDVTVEEDIINAFKIIVETFGGVDMCINNAGLGRNAPLLTGSTQDWKNLLEVNVLALCICTRESIANMRQRGIDDGYIINVSSMSGYRITEKSEHFYGGTKHAVKALTEGLRRELREINSHIRITCISPGNVKTEFLDRMFDYDKEERKLAEPHYKVLEIKDIVDTVIYVLSTPSHVQIHDILVRPVEQEL